jgi:hypothetical protein
VSGQPTAKINKSMILEAGKKEKSRKEAPNDAII